MIRRPNILFFFPDQHRGDWTGYRKAQGVRTPNLDALAARGQVFGNALTPSPVCSPARACMAAVAPYDAQPVKHNQHDMTRPIQNMYQALRNAGYQVLGCGKFDLLKGSMDWGESGHHGEGDDAKIRQLGFTDGIDNAGKHDFVAGYRRAAKNPSRRSCAGTTCLMRISRTMPSAPAKTAPTTRTRRPRRYPTSPTATTGSPPTGCGYSRRRATTRRGSCR